jgi:gas vesicle protein
MEAKGWKAMDNNRGLVIFGLGCAAGVAATLMLKSKSGQDAVEYLRSKAEEGTKTVKESMDKVRESVDNLSEAVTGAAARGAKAVKYQAENVGAALDAGKKAFKNAQEMTP